MSLGTLYLIFCVIPSFAYFLQGLQLLGFVGLTICGVAYLFIQADMRSIEDVPMKSWVIKSLMVIFTSSALAIFIPDKNQVYLLTGAYAVSNSAEIARLPDNIAKAANRYLEKLNQLEGAK